MFNFLNLHLGFLRHWECEVCYQNISFLKCWYTINLLAPNRYVSGFSKEVLYDHFDPRAAKLQAVKVGMWKKIWDIFGSRIRFSWVYLVKRCSSSNPHWNPRRAQLWGSAILWIIDLWGSLVAHLNDLIHIYLETDTQSCVIPFRMVFITSKNTLKHIIKSKLYVDLCKQLYTVNDYISATTLQLFSSCTSSLITSRSSP